MLVYCDTIANNLWLSANSLITHHKKISFKKTLWDTVVGWKHTNEIKYYFIVTFLIGHIHGIGGFVGRLVWKIIQANIVGGKKIMDLYSPLYLDLIFTLRDLGILKPYSRRR